MPVLKYKPLFASYPQLNIYNQEQFSSALIHDIHQGFTAYMILMMTWQSYQNTEVTLIDHSAEIFKTLNYLSNLLHSIKNPLGTRDNPARICKDLLNCEHKVSDGKFLVSSESDVCLNFIISVHLKFTKHSFQILVILIKHWQKPF